MACSLYAPTDTSPTAETGCVFVVAVGASNTTIPQDYSPCLCVEETEEPKEFINKDRIPVLKSFSRPKVRIGQFHHNPPGGYGFYRG